MSNIKIITDSCSDLPEEIIAKYDIEFLSIPVNINNKTYYDRDNLKPSGFYNLISEAKTAQTSRITPTEFIGVYKKYLNEYDNILVLSFSSKLSGILESAVLAKKEIKSDKITIIDTKAASVGQGLLVYQAAKMVEAGKDIQEIITTILESGSKLEHVFAVGDIEMLKQGGRISRTKAAVANVLNIKPILHIQDGEILPYDKVRGKKRMISYLVNEIEKKAVNPEAQTIALTYSCDQENLDKLKKKIEANFNPQEIFVSEIGAAVGSHAGPGTLAVVFQNSKKVADLKVY